MAFVDAVHSGAIVSHTVAARDVILSGKSLNQSMDESLQSVNEMKAMISNLSLSMDEFRRNLNQAKYNSQFILEIEPRTTSIFDSHLHPGLILGKGFGVMEHLNGNRADDDVPNYWKNMYLEFKSTIDARVQIDHIVISSEEYILNDYWVNAHPVLFVDDLFVAGEVVFKLVVPVQYSKALSVQIVHVSEESTPSYEVVVNHEVSFSPSTSSTNVYFELPLPPEPDSLREQTSIHGNYVEWDCYLKFTSEELGYDFDFEQLKLNLQFAPDVQQLRFNYLPMKSILKYTTVDDTSHVTDGLAYIDSIEPAFLNVEKTRLIGLKVLEINVHAKYPYISTAFPMFTSMRYDVTNSAQLTPLDVSMDSSFVFSDGEMKWIFFNNVLNLTCDVTIWQIDAMTEQSDSLRLKLPSIATPNRTGKYTGRCVAIPDEKLAPIQPNVYIDVEHPEYVYVTGLYRSLSPSYANIARTINLNIQIDYVVVYDEFVRTIPTLQWTASVASHLQLTNVTFRNGTNQAINVQIVEDNHRLSLAVHQQSTTTETLTRSLFSASPS